MKYYQRLPDLESDSYKIYRQDVECQEEIVANRGWTGQYRSCISFGKAYHVDGNPFYI